MKNKRCYYERAKIIFLSTFAWGILAHGFMIFNKFSFHDDTTCLFGLDTIKPIVSLGRWMKALLELIRKVFYGYDYSLSVINGVLFFFLIAFGLFVLSIIMEIENKLVLIVLSGIMVVIPTVTCLFGYIYCGMDYGFGFFLSIVGTCLICINKKWYLTIIGVICFTCSVGIYQSCFCSGICVFMIFMIKETKKQKYSWREFVFEGLKYILFSIFVIILYLVILKIFLKVLNLQMTDYRNLNSMGIAPISEYLKRLFDTYGAFFCPNKYIYDYPYHSVSIILYWIIIAFLIGTFFLTILEKIKDDKRTAVQLAILYVLFPIAVESIFLLTDACYSMMCYSHVFIYLLLAFLVGEFSRNKWILMMELLTIFSLNITFCNYSNTCYLKANLLHENAIGYFNILITRIQSIEGYSSDLPIVYIEAEKKENIGLPNQLEDITTVPYNDSSIVNNYAWTLFMRQWCGYNPTILPQIEYQGLDEVQKMSIYPNDGSIKIINGVIVVKFADPMG